VRCNNAEKKNNINDKLTRTIAIPAESIVLYVIIVPTKAVRAAILQLFEIVLFITLDVTVGFEYIRARDLRHYIFVFL